MQPGRSDGLLLKDEKKVYLVSVMHSRYIRDAVQTAVPRSKSRDKIGRVKMCGPVCRSCAAANA